MEHLKMTTNNCYYLAGYDVLNEEEMNKYHSYLNKSNLSLEELKEFEELEKKYYSSAIFNGLMSL